MNIAWFTPFLPSSAIGKFSTFFIAELLKEHQVTVFADGIEADGRYLTTDAPVIVLNQIKEDDVVQMLPAFDAVIYNMGNYTNWHKRIYDIMRRHRGIVILHDLVMHHFFTGYYWEYPFDLEGYLRELSTCHGPDGYEFGRRMINGEAGTLSVSSMMLDYHMALSVVRGAHGVITHSPYSARIIEKIAPCPVRYIPLSKPLVEPLQPSPRGEKVRLLSFGMVNKNKLIGSVIQTIADSKLLRERVVYDIIGGGEPDMVESLQALIKANALEDQVKMHGYQPNEVLYQALTDADVIINLRNPHFGESSATVVESMLFGKANIVWNHGDYGEFPDGAVIKIDSMEDFARQLETLVADEKLRNDYGQSARAHVEKHFITANSARSIAEFAESIRANRLVLQTVDFVTNEMRLMGANADFAYFTESTIQALNELLILDSQGTL